MNFSKKEADLGATEHPDIQASISVDEYNLIQNLYGRQAG